MDIHVLSFGHGYEMVFKFIATFVAGSVYLSLLKIAALIGIITTTTAYLKGRDPLVYAKWIFIYTVISGLILTPKTTVKIVDRTKTQTLAVANIPYVIALAGSFVTTAGVSLAEAYESLLSLPGDRAYSQTGMLFGANLLKATHQFHITSPSLKADMNRFFRNCVVGDIAINHKYTAAELKESENALSLFMNDASPVRHTVIDGKIMSCKNAITDKKIGLKVRLDKEVKNAYTIFGRKLLPAPTKDNTYEKMFKTHLGSATEYFRKERNEAESIVMQNMMINAIDNGLTGFSAKTDSSAGILNNQFSKSQTQHREAWNIGFEKAVWVLPLMHSVLLLLCFATFPLILVFVATPGGAKVFKSFMLFLVSFQLWPVLFSILNTIINMYGSYQMGDFGMVTGATIDSLEQAHNDLAGVAGFLMMSIPFLAKGFTSNIGESFAGLATSLTSHMQSSSMGVASEVANASFTLGNNSVHNMTANTLSENKHDTNWTEMHGNYTEQTPTNALITQTASGSTVVNSSPAMGHSAIGISDISGISNSLNNLREQAYASERRYQQAFNSSIQESSHDAMNFNQAFGEDTRNGHGFVSSESTSASNAMSRIIGKAEDVAQRLGISTLDALSKMSQVSLEAHMGVDSRRSLPGKLLSGFTGAHGGGSIKMDGANTSNHSTNASHGLDSVLSAQERQDLREDLQTVMSYSKSHHLDTNNTQSENMLIQTGNDLRKAQVASENLSNSISNSMRIAETSSFVTSNAANISRNLNQEAFEFGVSKVGKETMIDLESNPGDTQKMNQLQTIKADFLAHKAQSLLDEHNKFIPQNELNAFNEKGNQAYQDANKIISAQHQFQSQAMKARHQNIIDKAHSNTHVKSDVESHLAVSKGSISNENQQLSNNLQTQKINTQQGVINGKHESEKFAWTGAIESVGKQPSDYYQALKNTLGDKR